MDSQTSSRTAYSLNWTNTHSKSQTKYINTTSTNGNRFRACFWNFSLFGLLRKQKQPPLLPIARFSDTKVRSYYGNTGSSENYAGEEKREFHDISFDLGTSDALKYQTTSNKPAITLQELAFPIQKLGGAKFPLTLPTTSNYASVLTAPPLMRQASSWHQSALEDPFIKMLPESCQKVSEKASPLGLVPKLLPPEAISDKARYVGSSFWTWLCTVDDLTENLTGKGWENAEADLFRVFSDNYKDESQYHDYNSSAVKVSMALRAVVETTVVGVQDQALWRRSFNQAVSEVLVGFREERPLLESESISMKQWMRLRVITISVRPFLLLARADIGLPATTSKFGNPLDPAYPALVSSGAGKNLTSIRKIECLLQIILGLQNDILGWEKDSNTNNPLSAVQILIEQGIHPAVALNNVITIHNNLVKECVVLTEAVLARPLDSRHVEGASSLGRYFRTSTAQREEYEIRKYVEIIVGFANGMAQWMAVSKRYIA